MNFSVLLSLYIKESSDNLNAALTSIWTNQTIRPSEIIIVQDGPITNELSNCLQKWENNLNNILKIIILQNNLGLGLALNEGLKHCSFEWVFRMDTDDIATNDRFEKQINFIQTNPDIDLLGGQIIEFNNLVDDTNKIKKVPITTDAIKKFAAYRCPFNHMTVAYKKSIILNLGGYQHHLYMEDYNLWLRVISNGYLIANLNDVILYARTGNGMHGRRKGLNYIKSELRLASLKIELGLQNMINAYFVFTLRSSARLIPTKWLSKFYNIFLRKNFSK